MKFQCEDLRPVLIFLLAPRLPRPGQTDVNRDSYRNVSGFSSDAMRDLQRVIACLHMDKPEDMQCSAEYLAKVAQSSGDFGARVTVPMSAQSGWRQGFDLGYGMVWIQFRSFG